MVVIAGEARLLARGRRGAQTEVDRLYRRYSDEVLRYALLVLRSRPDAEDVLQATFVRALRAIARGERVQKPRNWLIKIAHNECRRALQQRSRRSVEVELEEVAVEPAEAGRADELRRALSQLAPSQRDALVLRELEGRSYAEIARALELSESAVETLIFRARRALREQLETGIGCQEAAALLQLDAVAPEDRKRLRGHLRGCADCAALERQARGRKGALRRIASSFGAPGWFGTWFGKVAAVALTVSAVGVVAAPAERVARPVPTVVPFRVDRPSAPAGLRGPAAAARRAHRRRSVDPSPRRAVPTSRAAGVVAPLTLPGHPAAPVASADPVAETPVVPQAPATRPAAPAGPVSAPPQPAPPALVVALHPVDLPPVDLPPVDLPPVEVPAVTVTSGTVPPVTVTTVPEVTVPPVVTATPQVSVVPRVP